MDDLLRVEGAVSATASGNLTWERWPHDVATALGFAGQRNPVGFAVVRYLADPPSSAAVWNVVLCLTSELIRRGVSADDAKNAAWHAFDFWRDIRCRSCHGRGHVGATQQPCPVCGGSGHRRLPDGPETLRDAISALINAEQWMEGQLAKRLKDAAPQAAAGEYSVHLPALPGVQDSGFNSSAAAGFRGRFDGE